MLPVKTEKPWGYEILLEENKDYVLKEIFMKKKCMCSLQYHRKKHESIYVLSGRLKLLYGKTKDKLTELIFEPGGYFVIPPKWVHRMCAIENAKYLEASTPHLTDVVRLEDVYGR